MKTIIPSSKLSSHQLLAWFFSCWRSIMLKKHHAEEAFFYLFILLKKRQAQDFLWSCWRSIMLKKHDYCKQWFSWRSVLGVSTGGHLNANSGPACWPWHYSELLLTYFLLKHPGWKSSQQLLLHRHRSFQLDFSNMLGFVMHPGGNHWRKMASHRILRNQQAGCDNWTSKLASIFL